MKLNKIFLVAVAAMGLFASCSDDDDYAPGQPAGEYSVYFAEEQPAGDAQVAISPTATTFPVKICRADGKGQLTVPIKTLAATSSVMSAPESVTFENGETEKTIDITCSTDMEQFKSYELYLALPEEYTSPYKTDAESPNLHLTVIKEDFVKMYDATWTDYYFFEDSWDVEVEYSAIKDLYRIKGVYDPTTETLFFKWDGKDFNGDEDNPNFYLTDEDGAFLTTTVPAGFSYGDYGAVSLTWDTASGYNCSADGEFMFYFEYTVSLGSFGSAPSLLTLKK